MLAAVIIFSLTYVAIAVGRLPFVHVDRPAAALCGAVAMVAGGVITLSEAYAGVSWDTITLLVGMMIIAAYLMEAAFFRSTAWWIGTRMRSARSLLWALVFVAGGLSALLVNDSVCLMFTPLVVAVIHEAQLPPLPYLLALASASNVGGMVTFTGNPQNMIVGMAADGSPGYLEYLGLVLPAGVLCLAATGGLIIWMFRHELPRGTLRDRMPPRPYLDRKLAAKALASLVLFVVLSASGVSLAGAAVTAAALLLLVGGTPPRKAFVRVDWVLLLFFAGLFVVVHGVAQSGALERLLDPLRPMLTRGDALGLIAFALLTVVGSNLVSNVPFVLVGAHWVPEMPEPRWGWIVLAVASTLAGNLTLFGSVANLIVFEGAGPAGRVSFARFMKHGAVITIVTLALALAVLLTERSLGL